MPAPSCLPWLAETFPEVEPLAFYRDLFPLGSLDKRGAMTKGKYCGIAVQVESGGKALRHTLTDELDNLEELVSSDTFTIISPLSYAGKSQRADRQREIYAIAVDLDNTIFEGQDPIGVRSLFSQIERAKILPRPTYIVASSARNVHLYYLLEEPLKAYAHTKETLAAYKTWLTKTLWNKYVTNDYDRCQQEPLGQSMRAVGSICKNPKDGRVRAFLCGDRVSVEYLNGFAPQSAKIELSTFQEKEGSGSGKQRPRWYVKPALYQWWLRQIQTGAVVGRRYFCCLCAAIFAQKSGIDEETLESDILDLVPFLDSLSLSEENRFTPDDALKAIQAFDNPRYLFMRRATLERISGIEIPPSKRNGRKIEKHLAYARTIQNFDDPEGSWRNKNGAPTKQKIVVSYAANHPGMSNRAIAKALGISKDTVNKWLKG